MFLTGKPGYGGTYKIYMVIKQDVSTDNKYVDASGNGAMPELKQSFKVTVIDNP